MDTSEILLHPENYISNVGAPQTESPYNWMNWWKHVTLHAIELSTGLDSSFYSYRIDSTTGENYVHSDTVIYLNDDVYFKDSDGTTTSNSDGYSCYSLSTKQLSNSANPMPQYGYSSKAVAVTVDNDGTALLKEVGIKASNTQSPIISVKNARMSQWGISIASNTIAICDHLTTSEFPKAEHCFPGVETGTLNMQGLCVVLDNQVQYIFVANQREITNLSVCGKKVGWQATYVTSPLYYDGSLGQLVSLDILSNLQSNNIRISFVSDSSLLVEEIINTTESNYTVIQIG